MANTQAALDKWIGGLRSTGADLNPSKSHWCLIDFKLNSKGEWKHKKINECLDKLCLHTMEGEETELERCEDTKGEKALGAKLRHDGVESENVKWF